MILETLAHELDIAYGAVWLAGDGGVFHLMHESGPLAPTIAAGFGGQALQMTASDGYGGEAIRNQKALVTDVSSDARRCPRWAAALAAGATAACILPLGEKGRVIALYEYYNAGELPFFGARQGTWDSLGRLLSHARRAALGRAELQETLDDRVAVTTVVTELRAARDQRAALRIALDTVREAFGWAYGSYWALDEGANVLRSQQESGSAGEEFRKATLTASFAEGVGLSGRTWRSRDLFFVRDIGEMTDCVRAPAAQRAGVKSGVCFPLLVGGRVIGTMDFFVTSTIELSESRGSALRNEQQLAFDRET